MEDKLSFADELSPESLESPHRTYLNYFQFPVCVGSKNTLWAHLCCEICWNHSGKFLHLSQSIYNHNPITFGLKLDTSHILDGLWDLLPSIFNSTKYLDTNIININIIKGSTGSIKPKVKSYRILVNDFSASLVKNLGLPVVLGWFWDETP